MHQRLFNIYLVDPGIVFWIFSECHAVYWYKEAQGWRFNYIRYRRGEERQIVTYV